ncbi:MAG: hypothetical protein GX895_10740 [Clostridiales bacterium]|uniref:hypothetical protein n=1 Tax=Clostridium sp. N3C TaxID=1776758 RepID=UPI00092DF84B|nr:hypothetical protein [Clostridium sp. N3C]NLZ49231.1 hypothetical protein [Clostridiales bacterium]SCN22386.1 hypothetical protein N3C_0739 [Clostridium sp. N3C]
MSGILSELSSSFCGGKSCDKNKGGNDVLNSGIFIWIALAVLLCMCRGGSSFGGFVVNPCCKSKEHSGSSKGKGVIVFLILLFLLFAGNGDGLAGNQGNVNTNIINVGTSDENCDDDYYEECSCNSSKC